MQIERKKRQFAFKDMNIPDNHRFIKLIYF